MAVEKFLLSCYHYSPLLQYGNIPIRVQNFGAKYFWMNLSSNKPFPTYVPVGNNFPSIKSMFGIETVIHLSSRQNIAVIWKYLIKEHTEDRVRLCSLLHRASHRECGHIRSTRTKNLNGADVMSIRRRNRTGDKKPSRRVTRSAKTQNQFLW